MVFGGKLAANSDKGGALEDGHHAWERCAADLYALDLLQWQWALLDDVTGYDPAALVDNNYQTPESELQALNAGIVACSQPSWQTGRLSMHLLLLSPFFQPFNFLFLPIVIRCEHAMVHVAPNYLYVIGGFTTASPQMNVVDTAHLADVQVRSSSSFIFHHIPFISFPM